MGTSLLKVSQYALFSDDIKLDLLVQKFLRENTNLSVVPIPETENERTLAVAASLIELFAMRSNQNPPDWTATIGAVDKPIFLNSDAMAFQRMRERCIKESPVPLRKRNIFSTANFLAQV